MTSRCWEFRGAQLDLARQMETLACICDFSDFIAGQGFNALILYLEARIRTPSFPWPSDDESYSLADMKTVVAHAERKGLTVVPVISNLGHAELFLKHEPLQHLAELREGGPSRFESDTSPTRPHTVFCPSLDETYAFFDAYFREVSDVFPGPWFHTGCDEVREIGCCSICRGICEGDENKRAALFARHLTRTHATIAGRLGKRMMVWDDMFEFYPSALPLIPKDVVMCTWLYESVIDTPLGHFGNRPCEDRFAQYESLGLPYVVVPRADNGANIATLSLYGYRYHPLGGFVSIWARQQESIYELLPSLGFAGALWSSGDFDRTDDILAKSLRKLLPSLNDTARRLVALHMWQPPLALRKSLDHYLTGPLSAEERQRRLANEAIAAVLDVNGQSELETRVLQDLAIRVRSEQFHLQVRELAHEVFGRRNGLAAGKMEDLLPHIEASHRLADSLENDRLRQWADSRPGISYRHMSEYWRHRKAMLDRLKRLARGMESDKMGLVRLKCCLPNRYGRQTLSVHLRYRGDADWTAVCSGIYKPDACSTGAFFEFMHPIESTRDVVACKLESWGYGGIGLAYVDAINDGGRYRPSAVDAVSGEIAHSEWLLHDNRLTCWLGNPDSDVPFHAPGIGRLKHAVVLSLRHECLSLKRKSRDDII